MANYIGPVHKRLDGPENEQPFIPLGIFKIRLPFIHYEWEWPEAVAALFMMATCLGAVPIIQELFGVSFEVAVTMVIINGFLYSLHVLFGDPVVPGWITPAIPLVIAHVSGYAMGPERVQVVVAVNIMIGLIFIVLGSTGIARKFVNWIPDSLKAAIILGAGISAFNSIFVLETGRIYSAPIAMSVGFVIAVVTLFSPWFQELGKRNPFMAKVSGLGMVPAVVVALIVGPMAGEFVVPEIVWRITPLHFRELYTQLSPFSVGWPTMKMIIEAIPLIIAIYIIAFGDFVFSQTVIDEADNVRRDEKIDYNPNRSNLISGFRNCVLGLVAPYPTNAGPLWAAMTVAVAERYKQGKKAMYSIWGGLGTFRIMTFLGLFIYPLVTLLRPALPIALAITLLVQAYACAYIALRAISKDKSQLAIAVLAGSMLALRGSGWGLATGIFMYLLVEKKWFKKSEEKSEEQKQ